MTKPLRNAVIVLLLFAALLAAAAWRLPAFGPQRVDRRQILMGTVVEVTAYGPDRGRLEAAVTAAFGEMARIDALMGPAAGSDPSRLSRAASGAEQFPELLPNPLVRASEPAPILLGQPGSDRSLEARPSAHAFEPGRDIGTLHP